MCADNLAFPKRAETGLDQEYILTVAPAAFVDRGRGPALARHAGQAKAAPGLSFIESDDLRKELRRTQSARCKFLERTGDLSLASRVTALDPDGNPVALRQSENDVMGMAGATEMNDTDLQVFEGARPRLLGLAYRILGSRADAEDAVQDCFLKWRDTDRAK